MSVIKFSRGGDLERALEKAGIFAIDGCHISGRDGAITISGEYARIAELEAALYEALNGQEVVVRGDAAGELERKITDDGGILWRRKFKAGA